MGTITDILGGVSFVAFFVGVAIFIFTNTRWFKRYLRKKNEEGKKWTK